MYALSVTENGQGVIQIDCFRELFSVDFSFWTKVEYEAHWQKASEALKAGQVVSFIQSMSAPKSTNFYTIWAAYPVDEEIIFQEQLLFLNELEQDFDIEQPHLNALPYEEFSEDGEPISQWRSQIE